MLAVHFGRSANCSSMGSVIDVLFVSSVVGSALLGALALLLKEKHGAPRTPDADGPPSETGSQPKRNGREGTE